MCAVFVIVLLFENDWEKQSQLYFFFSIALTLLIASILWKNLMTIFLLICFLILSYACAWWPFFQIIFTFLFCFSFLFCSFAWIPASPLLPNLSWLMLILPGLFQFSASESFKEWQIQKFEKNLSVRMKTRWHTSLSLHLAHLHCKLLFQL